MADSSSASAPAGTGLGPPLAPPGDLAERSDRLERDVDKAQWWRAGLLLASLKNVSLLIAMVIVVAALVLAWQSADARWLGGLLLVSVAINLIVFGIARASRRFGWLGVAVFLSVPAFGGVLSAVRTLRTPKLQPAALIRKSDNVGLCGVYITETDKRVYLGRIEPQDKGGTGAKSGSGRIFWVPESDVDMIKIGKLQPIRAANVRAAELLAELYADRAEDPGVARKNTTVTSTKKRGSVTTETVTEKAPHPRQQSRPRPEPTTSATVCTSVSLADPPEPPRGQPPTDDSPRDP